MRRTRFHHRTVDNPIPYGGGPAGAGAYLWEGGGTGDGWQTVWESVPDGGGGDFYGRIASGDGLNAFSGTAWANALERALYLDPEDP